MIESFNYKTCSNIFKFKLLLVKKIDELNKKNSRCNPLLVSDHSDDIMICSQNLDAWHVMIHMREIKGEIKLYPDYHEN